jgi:hypothetical protein
MTVMTMPKFINSKYFVGEQNNWHLLPSAPEELKKEFKEWITAYNNVSYKEKMDNSNAND